MAIIEFRVKRDGVWQWVKGSVPWDDPECTLDVARFLAMGRERGVLREDDEVIYAQLVIEKNGANGAHS